MNESSWVLAKFTLVLSCAIVFAALVVLIDTGELTDDTYHIYLMAKEIAATPAGLFLISGIGSILLEDRSKRG